MNANQNSFHLYSQYLKQISFSGRIYKRFFSSVLLNLNCRSFGSSILEVGSGIGSGVLGAFPDKVVGIDINPIVVDYCLKKGFDARLIGENGVFPFSDSSFDTCILDNVLEHIHDPRQILDECSRVTKTSGGLVIVVPGIRGYSSDLDHKVFYDASKLRLLDNRWKLKRLFAMPTFIASNWISCLLRQYCLVAIYVKN